MDVDAPDAQLEDEDEDEDAPRSSRPGQKGFAARLMSKYGWSKGQGLGAEGTGMLAPLRVQVEKRKKKSDAEGGGWRQPAGLGKIVQPKTNANAAATSTSTSGDQGGKFGPMSNVIVLRRMLDNIEDLRQEMEEGLGQEIGEECGDKYGRVERLYIDVAGGTRNVYIKFVETVSALRAVNALDGRVFAGSNIEPRFYDVEQFEKGVYE
jgi:splicing factor 45